MLMQGSFKMRGLRRVGSVHMADGDAQVGDHPGQEAGCAAVQVPASHNVPAAGHEAHHRGQRRHATAKGKCPVGTLRAEEHPC